LYCLSDIYGAIIGGHGNPDSKAHAPGAGADPAQGWSSVMVRKLLIALAAAAAVTAGSTMTASAMHGWHGMGGGFAARPFGFHEHRFGFHHFPFFPNRFALYGVGYPYTEDCFAPIWTPWGWRWRYMCY
jgi:hypothetical protein